VQLRRFTCEREEYDELSALLATTFDLEHRSLTGARIRILEAGCGRRWELSTPPSSTTLVGVDRDLRSLRLRIEGPGDLDVAIHGDLADVAFRRDSFDVVYSAFVLEHVVHPAMLLDQFAQWLRPGGLLVLRIPDRDSVYAFAARHTPHRFHVWFRRRLLGFPDAGRPGFGPFPVVYDTEMSLPSLVQWGDEQGLALVDAATSNHYVQRLGRWRRPIELGLRSAGVLSGGTLAHDHNNLALVFAKPGTAAGDPRDVVADEVGVALSPGA
jgi:SAM-dependent methyltransferase